jgi:hypothetical protein
LQCNRQNHMKIGHCSNLQLGRSALLLFAFIEKLTSPACLSNSVPRLLSTEHCTCPESSANIVNISVRCFCLFPTRIYMQSTFALRLERHQVQFSAEPLLNIWDSAGWVINMSFFFASSPFSEPWTTKAAFLTCLFVSALKIMETL